MMYITNIILICLAILCVQAIGDDLTNNSWTRHRYRDNYIRDANLQQNQRNRHSYFTTKRPNIANDYQYDPPITHTEYALRTVQTGSALVPITRHNNNDVTVISPDHNLTKSFLTKTDTTIITAKKNHRKMSYRNHHHNHQMKKPCVKCPNDQIVVAQRRLDGVLIEPPSAMSCTSNHPFSKSLYEIETLFGPKYMFVLPQGSHSIIGKVMNKRTGAEVQKCMLKYNVIVRQCKPYRPKNVDLMVAKCDLGNIWGSVCTFSCKNGASLERQANSLVCGDDLEWSGDEPTCRSYAHYDYDNNNNENDSMSCELPLPPENGKFACAINSIEESIEGGNNENAINYNLRTPNGSLCTINCNKHYQIPQYLQKYGTFYCNNGRFNSTMLDFCQRIPKKI